MSPEPKDFVVRDKEADRLMRICHCLLCLVGSDTFMLRATTYRLPFQRYVRICVPARFVDLKDHQKREILRHEHFHVRQFAPWYGPWLMLVLQFILPLPVFFSGRWFIERHAYLDEIRHGGLLRESAVRILWEQYGWPWPRILMRKWFDKKLVEGAVTIDLDKLWWVPWAIVSVGIAAELIVIAVSGL